LRQVDVLMHYLLTILQFEDLQILSQSKEPLLLSPLLFAHLSLSVLQRSQFDACIYGTTRIHHLLSLQRQRVAPTRSREPMGIGKVTIHYHHVAVHQYRCRRHDLRQPCRASRLNSFSSKFYAYLLLLKSLAVAFHKLKQFVNCHPVLRLSLHRLPGGYNH